MLTPSTLIKGVNVKMPNEMKLPKARNNSSEEKKEKGLCFHKSFSIKGL